MGNILSGLVLVNGTDIWTEYGVFLVEERRGGMENLTAILTPSQAKKDTAVDIREEHGEKYSTVLTPRNEARDVTLHFEARPLSKKKNTDMDFQRSRSLHEDRPLSEA